MHPFGGVRTLNIPSGGRCWRGVFKIFRDEHLPVGVVDNSLVINYWLCRTDLMAVDRLLDFTGRLYVLVLFFSVLDIPKFGRQSWPALWSTFRRTIK